MLRRSQDIISAYLTNTYEQFLNEKCILTSITKPKNKTNSVVDVIGRFEPIVKRKKYANNPIISVNYLDETNLESIPLEFKDEYLEGIKNIGKDIINNSYILYSLAIDYKLINDEIIDMLKKKYHESKFTLRIIGGDFCIDTKLYEKLSFIDEIVVSHISEDIVLLNGSNLIDNQNIVIDNIIPDRKYQPINEFYLNKFLSNKECALITSKINATISNTKRLYFRMYEPSKYGELVKKLSSYGLGENVEINILGNPILDKIEDFEFIKSTNYKITVTFTTNPDRISKLTEEPYSDSHNFIEELECSNKVDSFDYLNILYSSNFLKRKTSTLELSPFETIVYVYRYIEKNSTFFIRNSITKEKYSEYKNGFATLFSILLRRLNIPVLIYTSTKNLKNICRIIDKKYKMDRIITFDITRDINTNRYQEHKIYSFTYFGSSPLTSMNESIKDYLTIPATLSISKEDYLENGNKSYNRYIKLYNPTETPIDFAKKALKIFGFTEIDENTTIDEFYDFIADYQTKKGLKSIESSAISSAVERIVQIEINSNRKKQKEYEITNSAITNELYETELLEETQILINLNNKKTKAITVSKTKPKSLNEDYNTEEHIFTKEIENIIKDIYSIKENDLIHLTDNQEKINYLEQLLKETLNEENKYKLLNMDCKKDIVERIYKKYEDNLFTKISKKLYLYLKNTLIPELKFITESKELNYLSLAKEEDYNTKEFDKYYKRVERNIKYFIDKLIDTNASKLGISYEYKNYNFSLKFKDSIIQDYHLNIVSADIIAISTMKTKTIYTIDPSLPLIEESTKMKEYIEVYIDKLISQNKIINKSNDYINEIELLNVDIRNKESINRFIELEKKLSNQEKKLFNKRVELSNLKSTYLSKYNKNIQLTKDVKKIKQEKHIYTVKYSYYDNLLTEIKEYLLTLIPNKEVYLNSKKQLMELVDSILSYLNRRIMFELDSVTDISNMINQYSSIKKEIINELDKKENISDIDDINIDNRELNFVNKTQPIKYNNKSLLNLENIKLYELIKNIVVKKNKKSLNRLKRNSKK